MVHGKYSSHLLPVCCVAWAQLALVGFAWTAGQRQGLLCLIATVHPQDHGLGAPILGPRVSDHGPLVLGV